MYTLCLISEPGSDRQWFTEEHNIKDNKIRRRIYSEDGESYYPELVTIEVDRKFYVHILAEFIMVNNSPLHVTMGMREINHFAYSYSVNIIEASSNYYYDSFLIHTESGVKTTDFGMYSYHTMVDNKTVYSSGQLEYEVYKQLDLDVLIPHQ